LPRVEAFIEPLHTMPVPLVYPRALEDPVQLGIENATGLAVDPVKFATTVLAASVAKYGRVTEPFGRVNVPLDERFVNEPVEGVIAPTEPLRGPLNAPANVVPLTGPVKVAPASFEYKAN